MFHSSGTIQSKTRVPLGTSVRVIGICSSIRSKVARTPSPVRLRQSGNSRSHQLVGIGPDIRPRRRASSTVVTRARPCGRRTPRRRSSASCTPCRAAAAGPRTGPRSNQRFETLGLEVAPSGGRSCAAQSVLGERHEQRSARPCRRRTSGSRTRGSGGRGTCSRSARSAARWSWCRSCALMGEDQVRRELRLQPLEEVLDLARPRRGRSRRGSRRRSTSLRGTPLEQRLGAARAPPRRARPRR